MKSYAALLMALALPVTASQAQAQNQDPGEVQVEDIVVMGRSLDQAARDYVTTLATPARGRSLARWHDRVCVGVVNLRNDMAEYLADVISTRAEDLGLRTGAAGCSPNVVILFTDDGAALARTMVENEPRTFIYGGSGMDRGRSALGRFQQSDAAVRWWHVSMPIHSETGRPAVRMPGETDNKGNPSAPRIGSISSRLTTSVRDDLQKVIIVVDVDGVTDLSLPQLADYLSMVALAQVDMDSDTTGFPSVMNVLADPASATGMTEWDEAFLQALYRDDRGLRRNPAMMAGWIAGDLAADLRRTTETEDAALD